MRGHCLCGTVSFSIELEQLRFYQCHCSWCRRQSGAAASAATIVPAHRFRWLTGETSIRSWRSPEGFRSDFCRECGAPLPNPLRDLPYVWVPAGLLDAAADGEIVAHLCVDSRALWDRAVLQGHGHGEVPELPVLLEQLGIAGIGTADRS